MKNFLKRNLPDLIIICFMDNNFGVNNTQRPIIFADNLSSYCPSSCYYQ